MSNLFETSSEFTTPAAVSYVKVAPERAFDATHDGLTYGLPADLADLTIGTRVLIPLGRGSKLTPGIIVSENVNPITLPKKAKIKLVAARDPKAGGALTPELVELGNWIAAYYASPLGMTLTSMLPAAVKHGSGMKRITLINFTPEGRALYPDPTAKPTDQPADSPLAKRLTKLQKQILETLQNAESRPIEIRDLANRAQAKTLTPIKRLIAAGLIEQQLKTSVAAVWDQRTTHSNSEADRPVSLTNEQATIVNHIGALLQPPSDSKFSAHAIYGVTGSGKTEVYLRLIEKVVRAGRSAIVLVPEIALTPQTVTRFKARFEALMQAHTQASDQDQNWHVAVLHSGLTSAQRHQQWQLVQSGQAPIVIGARSAIFAPIVPQKLGIIIVDEEHDNSYKQDQVPRYHARDVAVKRAQLANCPVILGSATPSLETYANAKLRANYHWHEITQRVPGAQFPTVEVVDLADERKRRQRTDRHVHLLGPRLESRMASTLHVGGDIILLLNRRGYANYIACPDQNCGWVMTCNHCDVAMVYHKKKELPRGGFVRCHHCQAEQVLPAQCPVCAKKVNTFGLGTQRIEEELIRKFPHLAQQDAILRMDSDTMHRAQDYDEALTNFRDGNARILVGTQMIAKGLDFPNVRLVGVINADTAINLPDFRAAERTYQLIAQVAGRSGRAEQRGHVVVQTFQPNLPAVQHAAKHDYHGFAEQEIADRFPAALPPIGRMARIVIRHQDHLECAHRARTIYEALEAQIETLDLTTGCALYSKSDKPLAAGILSIDDDVPPIRLRGPAPCPLSRIADHHRWSIEILSAIGPGPIQQVLTNLRNLKLAKSDTTTAIDVDPVQLL